MEHLTNNPCEDDGWRPNLESSSYIYMTAVKESQYRIVAKNRREQYEVKNTIRSDYIKRVACIIKWGSSYDNILYAVANLLIITKTTENSAEYTLQAIIPLSYDTLKDYFSHMGGKISDLKNLKKQTVMLDIARIWGKDIIEEG